MESPRYPARADRADSRPGRDALSGVTVLVVEDDELSREGLELVLAHYGADVIAAASVVEALRAFDRGHPGLIVSDIGLPGDDGYSLIRQVRARDQLRRLHTPAIAVSGFGGSDIGPRALAAGFDEFMLKPVEVRALLAACISLIATAS